MTEKWWRRHAGWTFWVYIFLYGVSRFVIELFRGDPRGMTMGYSTSQVISMVLVPLSVVMLVALRRSKAVEPAQAAAPPKRKRAR
jgi:phosphatidylglycerol:prolipoprotein diacylglycerol transferase